MSKRKSLLILILLSLNLGAWSIGDGWRTDRIIYPSVQVSGLSMPMVLAQMYVESRGDWGAVSREGCRGSMQIHPRTAKDYGIPRWTLDHPVLSLQAGITIMSTLWTRFENVSMPEKWRMVLSAYNCGRSRTIHAIHRYGRGWQRGIPAETRKYILKIQNRYYGGGK